MKDFHIRASELPIVKQIKTTLADGRVKYHAVTVEVNGKEGWLFACFWPFASVTTGENAEELIVEYIVKPHEVEMFLHKISMLLQKASSVERIGLVAQSR